MTTYPTFKIQIKDADASVCCAIATMVLINSFILLTTGMQAGLPEGGGGQGICDILS